jgi:hypothetical protein
MEAYKTIVDEAIEWGVSRKALTSAVTDRLAVSFGAELARIEPADIMEALGPSRRERTTKLVMAFQRRINTRSPSTRASKRPSAPKPR